VKVGIIAYPDKGRTRETLDELRRELASRQVEVLLEQRLAGELGEPDG